MAVKKIFSQAVNLETMSQIINRKVKTFTWQLCFVGEIDLSDNVLQSMLLSAKCTTLCTFRI